MVALVGGAVSYERGTPVGLFDTLREGAEKERDNFTWVEWRSKRARFLLGSGGRRGSEAPGVDGAFRHDKTPFISHNALVISLRGGGGSEPPHMRGKDREDFTCIELVTAKYAEIEPVLKNSSGGGGGGKAPGFEGADDEEEREEHRVWPIHDEEEEERQGWCERLSASGASESAGCPL